MESLGSRNESGLFRGLLKVFKKVGVSLVDKRVGLKRIYLVIGGFGRGWWGVGWFRVRKI